MFGRGLQAGVFFVVDEATSAIPEWGWDLSALCHGFLTQKARVARCWAIHSVNAALDAMVTTETWVGQEVEARWGGRVNQTRKRD